ncbi:MULTISPECIES: hypothetical protein [unclassified Pseudofrankia]|uniref:hypothetical protein n=1 Tax=unclassified Pseudofrankia TaxID=2994372 RepID=UPI0012FF76E7|nr:MULTISPECIES: hypothetical protein [unclassified Pseudofrankia]MDT3442225.1 hypothetical protein [Pseudofrankia sp. BMG5.37]
MSGHGRDPVELRIATALPVVPAEAPAIGPTTEQAAEFRDAAAAERHLNFKS